MPFFLQRFLPNDPPITYRLFAETIGCMMFHFIGSVSPTPLANGISLITIVYFTAKMSGAHLNPAVSATFMLLGHTNPLEMILYWAAQIVGCIFGALWIAALSPQIDIRERTPLLLNDGCFTPLSTLSDAQVFGWEAVCTFCFIMPIFSVVWYTQQKSGYGNTGPLIIGLSLFASALASGGFTGGALNPARVLGSPSVFDCKYKRLYTYICGELAGAIMSAIAIIPCYGIASEPWYQGVFSNNMMNNIFDLTNSSIVIKTITHNDTMILKNSSSLRLPQSGKNKEKREEDGTNV